MNQTVGFYLCVADPASSVWQGPDHLFPKEMLLSLVPLSRAKLPVLVSLREEKYCIYLWVFLKLQKSKGLFFFLMHKLKRTGE